MSHISQAVAVGDGRNYITAIVTMDPVSLATWAERNGKSDLSYAELTQLPAIHGSIERFMERANAKLERWETVKKFAILDHELSVESGGVTPNMKIRRSLVNTQYADIIASMYEAQSDE